MDERKYLQDAVADALREYLVRGRREAIGNEGQRDGLAWG
jgi:hypothetical protein